MEEEIENNMNVLSKTLKGSHKKKERINNEN